MYDIKKARLYDNRAILIKNLILTGFHYSAHPASGHRW